MPGSNNSKSHSPIFGSKIEKKCIAIKWWVKMASPICYGMVTVQEKNCSSPVNHTMMAKFRIKIIFLEWYRTVSIETIGKYNIFTLQVQAMSFPYVYKICRPNNPKPKAEIE